MTHNNKLQVQMSTTPESDSDIDSLPDESKATPNQVFRGSRPSYRRFNSPGSEHSSVEQGDVGITDFIGTTAAHYYDDHVGGDHVDDDEVDQLEYVMVGESTGQPEPQYPIIPDKSGSLLHHYRGKTTQLLGPDHFNMRGMEASFHRYHHPRGISLPLLSKVSR